MYRKATEQLRDALSRAAEQVSFEPLLDGIRAVLETAGIPADRIQLPFVRGVGFRHPTLALVLLTWTRDDGFVTEVRTHEELDSLEVHGVVGTPFESVVLHGEPFIRLRLTEDDGGFEILSRMRERGYVDYCAVGVRMPTGEPQPLSIASKTPMPDDAGERVAEFAPLIGLGVYGVYRTSQAMRLAKVYIGRDSGPRVLAGEIKRGSTQRLDAGILFCDIRGFTAMSETLGAERVVEVVNEVFDIIGHEAGTRGGEILKFIGDAMLITFVEGDSAQLISRAMVETARIAVARVDALAAELGLPMAVGFGGHIGEVVRGNIGTSERLDFTVMGPAVNLASRLESMCKPLAVAAVFSRAVAQHVDGLLPGGEVELKGISEPQPVWVIERGG